MTMTLDCHHPILADGQCPACGAAGALVDFKDEPLPLISGDLVVEVPHLSGRRCDRCGEEFLDDESQDRYLAAAGALVEQARRAAGAQLRRIRLKLRLSQQEAALLAGGGPNAFSRYESGKAQPVAAVFNLFRLLDQHPELLCEIREPVAAALPTRRATSRRARAAAPVETGNVETTWAPSDVAATRG